MLPVGWFVYHEIKRLGESFPGEAAAAALFFDREAEKAAEKEDNIEVEVEVEVETDAETEVEVEIDDD